MRIHGFHYKHGITLAKPALNPIEVYSKPSDLPLAYSFATYLQHYVKPSLDELRRKLNS